MVRPPEPDRVDLHEPAEQEQHGRHCAGEAERAGRVARERRHADDAPLGVPRRLPELRVVACCDEPEMQQQQQADQDREDQHVRDVHPRPELRRAGERPVPDQRRDVRPDERQRKRDRVADRETHSRKQVVDERVAEVALEHREEEHRHADVVGELARLAERPREEDPEDVQHDRGDEDVGGPVMRLPHH